MPRRSAKSPKELKAIARLAEILRGLTPEQRRQALEIARRTIALRRQREALWDQLTLFGPPLPDHVPAQPAQLAFDDGPRNVVAIQTADLMAALRHPRPPNRPLRTRTMRLLLAAKLVMRRKEREALKLASQVIDLAARRSKK